MLPSIDHIIVYLINGLIIDQMIVLIMLATKTILKYDVQSAQSTIQGQGPTSTMKIRPRNKEES